MGRFFPQNALVIHFSYEYRTFFIHSKIHSIVRQKYSFKEFIHSIVRQKYSFKEFIHSKNNLIIHSMKIFIFLKNAVSATPNRRGRRSLTCGGDWGCSSSGATRPCWAIGFQPSLRPGWTALSECTFQIKFS